MTAKFSTAIFFYEKNYYENKLSDLPIASLYIKNFCVAGKIGIGVILYEKGKGKFVGDWEKPTTQKY